MFFSFSQRIGANSADSASVAARPDLKKQIWLKSNRTAFSEIFFFISKGFAIEKQVLIFSQRIGSNSEDWVEYMQNLRI